MRTTLFATLLMLLPVACDAQPRLVGGPCEGCEAVFEWGERQLTPTDTLPDFDSTPQKLLLSGTIIISIVLDLPTLGPPFISALRRQDMFLAGTVLMMLALTLLVGNLIADIVLAWSDPRIQYD